MRRRERNCLDERVDGDGSLAVEARCTGREHDCAAAQLFDALD